MSKEALKPARGLVSYFVREDAEPVRVAKHLFDSLGHGGRLRFMDLILSWLTMHAYHYRVTGERGEIGGMALAMLDGIDTPKEN